MLSLIKVLEAPHPKGKLPATEELEDDKDDDSEVRLSNVSEGANVYRLMLVSIRIECKRMKFILYCGACKCTHPNVRTTLYFL